VTLIPSLQKTLVPIENPYLTGMEGYLILQSSLDAEPGEILRLFKARDKAEKFIRMLKEGIELRPLRVWTEHMVIGMVFIAYLANLIINLTLHFAEKTQGVMVKNVKNLKKFLINLTETVIYPPNGFRFRVISNFTEPLKALFGDFIKRFEDKTLPLRW
jgi:transposase